MVNKGFTQKLLPEFFQQFMLGFLQQYLLRLLQQSLIAFLQKCILGFFKDSFKDYLRNSSKDFYHDFVLYLHQKFVLSFHKKKNMLEFFQVCLLKKSHKFRLGVTQVSMFYLVLFDEITTVIFTKNTPESPVISPGASQRVAEGISPEISSRISYRNFSSISSTSIC